MCSLNYFTAKSLYIGWRERNQQYATNPMFIIKPFISTCFGNHYAHHQEHSSRPSSTQPQPSQPVQNTICGTAHSCSPDDGHNDAQNMFRWKFDNKHQISCILLVSLSSPDVHDARSKEPKISILTCIFYHVLINVCRWQKIQCIVLKQYNTDSAQQQYFSM